MKTFFRLLTFLLCLELIVNPIYPALSLVTQDAYGEESTCAAGLRYDTTLNRCLTTDDATKVMNASANCAAGDVECYKNTAKQALNEAGAPERKENSVFLSSVTNIAAIAGPLAMYVAGAASSKSTCPSASFWAMVGGSVALFIGDNLANLQHKKRLKKIQSEWGKIVNPVQANGDKDKERQISIEAQGQAFEMLARAEDSLAQAAKMKKNFLTIAAVAYGASTTIALLEIAADSASFGTTKIGNICKTTPTPTDPSSPLTVAGDATNQGSAFFNNDRRIRDQLLNNLNSSHDIVSFLVNQKAFDTNRSSPSIEYYENLKKSFHAEALHDNDAFKTYKALTLQLLKNINPLIAVANAQETNAAQAYKDDSGKSSNIWVNLGVGAAAGYAASKLIGAKLITSEGRAIFSGVLTGMTLVMAKHAGEQAEASTRRAELLRKMKSEFATGASAIHACQSEDRNDPSKPNCYCYTSENQRNTNRSNSQVCQKLWAGINTKETNYQTTAATSAKVCITNTQMADPTCKCRTTKTCMKVGINGLKGINSGTMSMLSTSLDPVNSISSGSLDAANVDAASLANQAARLDAINKKLADSPALQNFKKTKSNEELKLTKDLTRAVAGMSPRSFGTSTSSGMPSNPGEAARMLEKEIESQSPIAVGGGNDVTAPVNGLAKETPEFGLTQEGLAAQENQIAEVMKQDLDYGGNDINEGSKQNIFELLSNRYQRSGMKRLFEETPSTPPAPATGNAQK